MATVNPRTLLGKLNALCERSFRTALELCVARTNRSVEIEHWLFRLMENTDSDLTRICRHYEIDPSRVQRDLTMALDKLNRGSSRSDAQLSPDLFDLIREAWVLTTLNYNSGKIRSGHLLAALLTKREFSMRMENWSHELAKIDGDKLLRELPQITADSPENEGPAPAPGAEAAAAPGKTDALNQFTTNLTERAQKGQIDPVIGRDPEIRQVIDILTRRRQNNPILTGEAGVGKTAVVEGFALRIVAGDVPPVLKNVQLRTLDLGLLQAGAGVKGEFENRLKNVIAEVKASPVPIILFVDEAHTLIGAGGSAGMGDAANLLKPALARGELRTIAATTWDEYKKYFETDPALKRRFQLVRVDEPDEKKAIQMMRGVTATLEKHHKVRVLDEAIEEAVRLSQRYIPDRQLPDKAVSVLDTACARVALSNSATPAAVEDCRREIEHIDVEINILKREKVSGAPHDKRLGELQAQRDQATNRLAGLEKQLEQERQLVAELKALRDELEKGELKPEEQEKKTAEFQEKQQILKKLQGDQPLLYPVVDGQTVAEIVSGWTGIPLGKMVLDEIKTVLTLREKMEERIIGQSHALEVIARRIQTARVGMTDPRKPIGVFLMVGPSGVGKTETALTLADMLYGGDRNMIIVNMSEYKEEYKVSQLIGSPRGYEGSQEGGVLTEAVRRRPYSVVLLDEVEKSHPSVQEIFYQVFDKGMLSDSRGIEVDFKNTIIILTSNVGTDAIMKFCSDPDTMPTAEKLAEALRPELLKVFKPALLGRMFLVPYYPLTDEVIKKVIRLQLRKVGQRLQASHDATFSYDDSVVDAIAARCKEVESGARNVDNIITGTLLPEISLELLNRLAEGKPIHSAHVGVSPEGKFTYAVQ